MEIAQNFYNAYCRPKSFFAEKDFGSWDPKIHGPPNNLQILYVEDIVYECGTAKHYPLAIFWNGISKNTILSVMGKMDDGIPSLSSYSSITSKKNKNLRATFKSKFKNIVYILNQRMMHCLRLG